MRLAALRPAIAASALAFIGIADTATAQNNGRIVVELNKFEQAEGSCRAFFLFRNASGMTLEGFEMSLAVLDENGVIDQLLTIDAAPLPIARTTLKLFEIPELTCERISEVLLHEMGSCKPQNADEIDCFEIMDLSSKTSAAFAK